MCFPLGPTLANVFIEKSPIQFKPAVYRQFAGDTFLLFRSENHFAKFKNHVNEQHGNMTFQLEIEEIVSLSFLRWFAWLICNGFLLTNFSMI